LQIFLSTYWGAGLITSLDYCLFYRFTMILQNKRWHERFMRSTTIAFFFLLGHGIHFAIASLMLTIFVTGKDVVSFFNIQFNTPSKYPIHQTTDWYTDVVDGVVRVAIMHIIDSQSYIIKYGHAPTCCPVSYYFPN